TIATARKMKEDAEVVAVLLGNEGTQAQAEEMIQHGADRAITVEHANLENYTSEGYGQALLEIIEDESPYGIVMGHTAIGKDVFTRPIYSGKAFEKKTIKDGLVFVTIRPNNIPMLEKDEGRSGEVTAKDIDIKDLRTVIQEIIRKKSEGIDMSEASIVVAGG